MSGASTDSIRCFQAIDCAAAGYGIPANSHYYCTSQGICTWDCNANYTLYSEACWLNGTVTETCDCSRSSKPTSTILPTVTTIVAIPTSIDSPGYNGQPALGGVQDGETDDGKGEINSQADGNYGYGNVGYGGDVDGSSQDTGDVVGSVQEGGDDGSSSSDQYGGEDEGSSQPPGEDERGSQYGGNSDGSDGSDESDGEDEVEEIITVTETNVAVVTAFADKAPSTAPVPTRTTTRKPKIVTVTELSVSTVTLDKPTVSHTHTKTKTRTRTRFVTVTSVSVSTAISTVKVPRTTITSKPKTTSKASTKASPKPSTSRSTRTPVGSSIARAPDCCAKTSDCNQDIPQYAHRICLKQTCSWRCNRDYMKKGNKCVKKVANPSKPPLPPCGCIFPTTSSSRTSKSTKSTPAAPTRALPASILSTPSAAQSDLRPATVPPTKQVTKTRTTRQVTRTVTATVLSTAERAQTIAATVTIFTAASPTIVAPSRTVTVTTPVTVSIAPIRPLPTPRIIYIETCSCDEDCTINVPADATPICDPKLATCTWACNTGFWINSDGSGCLPDGTAFAALTRQLMVLSPTVTRPHTFSLYMPTSTATAKGKPVRSSPSPTAANSTRTSAVPQEDPFHRNLTHLSTFSNSTPFLLQHYSPNGFFDRFFFADADDESNGFVNYVESQEAAELELTAFTNSTVTLSMDRSTNLSDTEPRDSVRLASKELVQPGNLLIIDLAHVPTGCFVYPSIYLHGANASSGSGAEIDIFDGSASRDYGRYTVRAPPGCNLSSHSSLNTKQQSGQCDVARTDCSVEGPRAFSSHGINQDGGGVIALQLDQTGISVWQWSRSQVPSDIGTGVPHRSTWGIPTASWSSSSCQLESTFRNLRLAFDITTCGDWRGQASSSLEPLGSCSSMYPTCEAAIRDPANFAEAYFEINSVRVYAI